MHYLVCVLNGSSIDSAVKSRGSLYAGIRLVVPSFEFLQHKEYPITIFLCHSWWNVYWISKFGKNTVFPRICNSAASLFLLLHCFTVAGTKIEMDVHISCCKAFLNTGCLRNRISYGYVWIQSFNSGNSS